jgi:hypothetical protein
MSDNTRPISDFMGPLFTPEDVAARYGYTTGGLANARAKGTGPRWIKLGNGQIRYPLTALLNWEQSAPEEMSNFERATAASAEE